MVVKLCRKLSNLENHYCWSLPRVSLKMQVFVWLFVCQTEGCWNVLFINRILQRYAITIIMFPCAIVMYYPLWQIHVGLVWVCFCCGRSDTTIQGVWQLSTNRDTAKWSRESGWLYNPEWLPVDSGACWWFSWSIRHITGIIWLVHIDYCMHVSSI